MAGKKSDKKDEQRREGNPNLIGEAGQVAGNTRDEGFGGMRGGGTGDAESGVGSLPQNAYGTGDHGSAEGSIGAEDATR
jgi:hypothetical protein